MLCDVPGSDCCVPLANYTNVIMTSWCEFQPLSDAVFSKSCTGKCCVPQMSVDKAEGMHRCIGGSTLVCRSRERSRSAKRSMSSENNLHAIQHCQPPSASPHHNEPCALLYTPTVAQATPLDRLPWSLTTPSRRPVTPAPSPVRHQLPPHPAPCPSWAPSHSSDQTLPVAARVSASSLALLASLAGPQHRCPVRRRLPDEAVVRERGAGVPCW